MAEKKVSVRLVAENGRQVRAELDDGAGREPFLVHDAFQHRLRIGEKLARDLALLFVLKDARIDALQLPCLEEGGPVDIARDLGQVPILDHPRAGKGRGDGRIAGPVDLERVRPRLG